MNLFLPVKRATLLIPSGPEHDPNRKHLFILLTDPVTSPTGEKHVLLVSISTVQPELPLDPACILHPGDHLFIKHKSYVSYRRARIEEADKILKGVKQGVFSPKGTIDTAIFARICDGLVNSSFTTPKILQFYQSASGG